MTKLPTTRFTLAEAAFFLDHMREVQEDPVYPKPNAFRFYLHAFLRAARSVQDAMECDLPGEGERYAERWRESLSADDSALVNTLKWHRDQAVHEGGAHVREYWEHVPLYPGQHGVFFMAPAGAPQPTIGVRRFKVATGEDALQGCSRCLELLRGLVDQFADEIEPTGS